MTSFEQPPQKFTLPENLDDKDLELIQWQCKIQHAESDEQIKGFTQAYSEAKKVAKDKKWIKELTSKKLEDFIKFLGLKIEKEHNKNGFREVPARFDATTFAPDPKLIEQAIKRFCEGFIAFIENPIEDERLSTDILYEEFEKTHPFFDGNGRVGDLLWKILETVKSEKWPKELPPNIFDEER